MTDRLKNIILLLICLSTTNFAFGQRERTVNWHFGINAGLKFLPTVASTTLGLMVASEGCATISDTCGNLLFYTDGITVYNKNHSIMTNGTGLESNYSSTQAALIIPKPQCDSIYYIFTTTGPSGFYCYSEVNMNLSAGLGAVTLKNVQLCPSSNEKQAAISHCNLQDVWVVCSGPTGSNYYSYLVSNLGVSLTPVISTIGSNIGGFGYLKFSPNGSYLANAFIGISGDSLSISNFNTCTGQATPFINTEADSCIYGISFSSNSSKLYVANTLCTNYKSYLWQYDLTSGIPSTIISSKTLIKLLPDGFFFGALQLGPDDKIYVAKTLGFNYLATINNPNLVGASCNYSDSSLSLSPNQVIYGLPNFIESYFNSPYSCPTITGIKKESFKRQFSIYPNPFSNQTYIRIQNNNLNFSLRLFDNKGFLKTVLRLDKPITELSKGDLTSGLYFYQITRDEKIIETGKLVIE